MCAFTHSSLHIYYGQQPSEVGTCLNPRQHCCTCWYFFLSTVILSAIFGFMEFRITNNSHLSHLPLSNDWGHTSVFASVTDLLSPCGIAFL